MKKKELVYREMLYKAIEEKTRTMSQAELSRKLGISLSTVNNAIKPLRKMNAVHVNKRSFNIIDIKKTIYYWASVRNIEKDIIYKTRVEKPVRKIESEMPSDAVFTAYSAYKFKFKDVPADYSEIYVYANRETEKEIEKRFPKNDKIPNLFVLGDNIKKLTVAQLFVDLWNLKEWYAYEFLKELKKRINIEE